MKTKTAGLLALTSIVSLLALPASAHAQRPTPPPTMTLPDGPFTFTWGDTSLIGSSPPWYDERAVDRGFDCQLRASLRPSGRVSRTEIEEMEALYGRGPHFIDRTVVLMHRLASSRAIEWGVLDCGMVYGTHRRDNELIELIAWIDLQVHAEGSIPGHPGGEPGQWSVSYGQSGGWRLRRSGERRAATYTARPERLFRPSLLEQVEGAAQLVCDDGDGGPQHIQWQPPLEAVPVTLTASSDNDQLVLWASLPALQMHAPDAELPPAGSGCRDAIAAIEGPFAPAQAALEAAGGQFNTDGAIRLLTIPWTEFGDTIRAGDAVDFDIAYGDATDSDTADGGMGALTITGTIRRPSAE